MDDKVGSVERLEEVRTCVLEQSETVGLGRSRLTKRRRGQLESNRGANEENELSPPLYGTEGVCHMLDSLQSARSAQAIPTPLIVSTVVPEKCLINSREQLRPIRGEVLRNSLPDVGRGRQISRRHRRDCRPCNPTGGLYLIEHQTAIEQEHDQSTFFWELITHSVG
jgi:hypothetical protein